MKLIQKLVISEQVVAHKVTDKKIIKKDKNRHSFINQKDNLISYAINYANKLDKEIKQEDLIHLFLK